MKTYLEFRDAQSSKFWEVSVKGSSFVVRYGKIGTEGQTKTKDFSTKVDATEAAEKLASSKRKKGYVAASDGKTAKTATATQATAKPARELNDRPNLDEAIELPETAATLHVYHGNDLENPDLPRCVNARSFKIESHVTELPSWLRGMKKLRELSLGTPVIAELPAWLDQLTDLRVLVINDCRGLESIPASVWKLPCLEELQVFRTVPFDHLDGIEKAPALRTITVLGEPLAANMPTITERIGKAAGVKSAQLKVDVMGFSRVTIERKTTAKIPKGTSRSAAAKRAAMLTTLPRGFICEGLDVSGQSFSDQDIELDLRGANLEDTKWTRCRFLAADMSRATLEGAVFEDCFMERGTKMDLAKARGVLFRFCKLNVSFEGADLRDAIIEDPGPHGFMSFKKADLRKAKMTFIVKSPDEGSWVELDRADLRDASLDFHLTAKESASIAKSRKTAAWKEASMTGAKTNAGTDIAYAPLKQKKAPANKGPVAKSIGSLSAVNGACWFVVADSHVAREWGGSKIDADYNELPGTDFARATEAAEDRAPIQIGSGKGVLGDVGDNGWSELWKDGDSWCLLYAHMSGAVKDGGKESAKLIGAQVAQLKRKGRATKGGRFDVVSGCMTLLIPYAANPFTPKQISSAAESGKVKSGKEGDALLVPVPSGTYEVTYDDLSHTDDLGEFFTRIRIARVKGNTKGKKKS